MSLRVLPTSAERPPEAQYAITVLARSKAASCIAEAGSARHGKGARHLARGCHFRRLPNIKEEHVGPAQQSLGFVRADTRHFGIGFRQHRFYCFHSVSPCNDL